MSSAWTPPANRVWRLRHVLRRLNAGFMRPRRTSMRGGYQHDKQPNTVTSQRRTQIGASGRRCQRTAPRVMNATATAATDSHRVLQAPSCQSRKYPEERLRTSPCPNVFSAALPDGTDRGQAETAGGQADDGGDVVSTTGFKHLFQQGESIRPTTRPVT